MASSSPTDVSNSIHPHPPVIVIFVISFGCLFLFGAILLCIWWFIVKKRKEKKLIQERKDINVDEHLKVQEMIIKGPHGPKRVLVQVDDDVRVHEDIHKNEVDMVGKGMQGEHKEGRAGTSGSGQRLSLPERQV